MEGNTYTHTHTHTHTPAVLRRCPVVTDSRSLSPLTVGIDGRMPSAVNGPEGVPPGNGSPSGLRGCRPPPPPTASRRQPPPSPVASRPPHPRHRRVHLPREPPSAGASSIRRSTPAAFIQGARERESGEQERRAT